jgi:hypothetical protein
MRRGDAAEPGPRGKISFWCTKEEGWIRREREKKESLLPVLRAQKGQ